MSVKDLRNLGVDRPAPENASARIPEAAFITLWQTIASHDAGRGVGLEIGQMINPEAKGLLASWVSQSRNLREALAIFRNNIQLMNPSESWDVQEDKQHVQLVFSLRKKRGYPDMAIERSMSAMIAWARALSGHVFPVNRAGFSFAAPVYEKKFHCVFGQNIEFACMTNHLVLDRQILELPVLGNNPLLKNIIRREASQALADIKAAMPVKEKVKVMIQQSLKSGAAISVNDSSRALAMSRQTLYRQLRKEGTDFQTLHDGVKKDEALKMLKAGLKVTAIAWKLGYKDSSSFYKAFHRWFAMSPTAYLESCQRGDF